MFELVKKLFKNDEGGMGFQHDDEVVKRYIEVPEFPFLISFPRTGSHWLRMIMELYFKCPALTRIFYFKNNTNFTCYHTHDIQGENKLGDIKRRNVIYLYRNAPETIFSQLNYHKEDINDIERIKVWSELYGRHLKKWLIDDDFSEKKVIIRYEKMKKDMDAEFRKVCDFYGKPFDSYMLQKVLKKVSKENIKKRTKHDEQVINLNESYDKNRKNFINTYKELINNNVFKEDKKLVSFF